MLTLKKVAVTGGLSSGKSTVCQIFKELGTYVVSADAIVHQLLSISHPIGQKVIKLLGSDIVVDQLLDRTLIAQKVFYQPLLLKSLEQILHPAVMKEIENQYLHVLQNESAPLFAAEIPLLFEGQFENQFDVTIAVVADQDIAQLRFTTRTGHTINDFNQRSLNQLSPSEKAQRASLVIHNNGSIDELKAEVKKIFYNLTKKQLF